MGGWDGRRQRQGSRKEGGKGRCMEERISISFISLNMLCMFVHVRVSNCAYVFRGSCAPGWPQTYYVAKDGLKLPILPPISKCMVLRHGPAHLSHAVVGMDPEVSLLLAL